MDQTLIQKALKTNIIEMLGLQALSFEEKQRLIDTLTELIGAKILARIFEKLSDADKEAFEKALDTGTAEQLSAWLKEKGFDMEQMAVEEVAKVKEDLMARVEANGLA